MRRRWSWELLFGILNKTLQWEWWCDLAQEEWHPRVEIRMSNLTAGMGSLKKPGSSSSSENFRTESWGSKRILSFWKQEEQLTCYAQVADGDCTDIWVRCWRTEPLFWNTALLRLRRLSGLDLKLLLLISEPGTVPMHFLACPVLLYPPLLLPLLSGLCLSEKEGWLTHLQQCSLIICLHRSDKTHPTSR